MIFVEGGEYLMGDFGRVTSELEKTVPNSAAVKNPKGNTQKIENLPFIPTTKGYNLGEFKHEVRQFQKPYDNQQAEQTSLMV